MRALAVLLLVPAIASGDKLARGPDALLQISDVVTGLGPVTDFAFLPGSDGRMMITEKSGELKVWRPGGKAVTVARFPVDEASEKGLLGVVADPDFARTRRLFLYYSLADDAGGTRLDRHRVVSVVLRPDDSLVPGSEKLLVRGLRGPANHDGGALAIGPDGKLYIGVGDTGCNSGRPPEPPTAPTNYFPTCLSNANGKILRINLDGTIPADNPLMKIEKVPACGERCSAAIDPRVTAPPRKEIWAWGFRNPWRFWFDSRTGKLWVGDVGEITYEEIGIAVAGRHHGWPWREGPHGWPITRCSEIGPPGGPCVDPVYHCRHGGGSDGNDGDCQSITGGVIVDSCRWPEGWRGRYLFGDNANARLWTLRVNPARDGVIAGSREDLGRLAGIPVSIHLGPNGDVYLAVFPGGTGRIIKIAPQKPEVCPQALPPAKPSRK